MDAASKAVDDLLNELTAAGMEITKLGRQYRVTNPKGGPPAFVPLTLKERNVQAMRAEVAERLGWDPAATTQQQEVERQQRMSDLDARLARAAQANADRAKAYEAEVAALRLARQQEEAAAAARAATAQTAPQPPPVQFTPPVVPTPAPRPSTPAPAATPAVRQIRVRQLEEIAATALQLGDPARGFRSEVIEIDADFAWELLQYNRQWSQSAEGFTNRPLKMTLVEAYADEMVAGRWLLTHQGIALSRDNQLLDGQHRLMAVVAAGQRVPGIKIPFVVSYDCDPDTFDRIDVGALRSMGDILGIEHEANRMLLAASLRMAVLYDEGAPNRPGGWHRRVTAARMNEYLEQNPQLRDSVRTAHRLAGHLRLLGSALATGHYLCVRAWPLGPMEEFVKGLQSGANLPHGDARLALLRAAGNQPPHRRRERLEHLAWWIKAWNAFTDGRSLTQLKWGTNEVYPVPTQSGGAKGPIARLSA